MIQYGFSLIVRYLQYGVVTEREDNECQHLK